MCDKSLETFTSRDAAVDATLIAIEGDKYSEYRNDDVHPDGGCGELNDPLIAEEFRENNSKMECVLGLVRITIARV